MSFWANLSGQMLYWQTSYGQKSYGQIYHCQKQALLITHYTSVLNKQNLSNNIRTCIKTNCVCVQKLPKLVKIQDAAIFRQFSTISKFFDKLVE
jgi:hypothetical protein